MTAELGVPTKSVLKKPLSSQSLLDSKFWCLHVTVIGDLGLDLIPHQVNPVADKDVQHFRIATERCFVADLPSLQLEAQGYTKSWIATWKGDKSLFIQFCYAQNSMFLGYFSYNVTTAD